MVAVLQYTTIIKIGAQRAQRSLFTQPSWYRSELFNGVFENLPSCVMDGKIKLLQEVGGIWASTQTDLPVTETSIAYLLTNFFFLQNFFCNYHKQCLHTCVPIHLISPPSSFNWALYLILCLIFVVMSFEVIVGWALTSTSASCGSSQFNCGAGWAFRASHVIWKSNDNMRMRGLCCLWVYVFYGVLGWKWSNLQPNLT